MIKLITNECMKLFFRRGVLISLAIFVVLAVGTNVAVKKLDDALNAKADWHQTVQSQIQDMKTQLASSSALTPERRTELANEIKAQEYALAHDIDPNPVNIWRGLDNSLFLSSVIGLFMVVFASGILTKEFEWGTIKLLLTRPPTRTKIYVSKFLTLVLTAAGMYVLLLVVSFLTSMFTYGFAQMGQPIVSVGKTGEIALTSPIVPVLANAGFRFIETFILLTIAYALSILLGNNSAAIVITLVLSVSGGPLGFFVERYTWLKYYLFLHADLSGYAQGNPPVPGMGLASSISIILVYMLILLISSWYTFKRRDLASK
ncbi:ABC transporter permease [Brevibacillus fluminis]|uniref:ABC transporter permease n=1 Tax=Brevibacillus fluminis TaxID=511487 RepID=UPI003F891F3F